MGSMLWRIYKIKAVKQINSVFTVVYTHLSLGWLKTVSGTIQEFYRAVFEI